MHSSTGCAEDPKPEDQGWAASGVDGRRVGTERVVLSRRAAGSAGNFQIAVPRDTVLKLHIASRDLKLGDDKGASLTANASQQAFQHTTGDLNPRNGRRLPGEFRCAAVQERQYDRPDAKLEVCQFTRHALHNCGFHRKCGCRV